MSPKTPSSAAWSTRIQAGLVMGFFITASLWLAAYALRFPKIEASAPVIGGVLMALLAGEILLFGRRLPREGAAFTGAIGGLVLGLVNLLALGSVLDFEGEGGGGRAGAMALSWVGFSIVAGALGAALGASLRKKNALPAPHIPHAAPDWRGRFGIVAAAAVFPLIVIGGIVTSAEQGMVIPDWPTSEGAMMFLYPLSSMTGGKFLEHAHRLYGSLAGLTVVVLTIWTMCAGRAPRWRAITCAGVFVMVGALALTFAGEQHHTTGTVVWFVGFALGVAAVATSSRKRVDALALGLLVLVIAQGIIGGLRVEQDSRPLAFTHGVTAQVFFALLCLLAAANTASWRDGAPAKPHKSAAGQRRLGAWALGLLFFQVALGAMARHFDAQLHGAFTHAGFSLVAFTVALAAGTLAYCRFGEDKLVFRLGKAVTHLLFMQMGLGVIVLFLVFANREDPTPPDIDVALATAHQAVGALLFAYMTLCVAWVARRYAALPKAPPAGETA